MALVLGRGARAEPPHVGKLVDEMKTRDWGVLGEGSSEAHALAGTEGQTQTSQASGETLLRTLARRGGGTAVGMDALLRLIVPTACAVYGRCERDDECASGVRATRRSGARVS